MKRIAAAFSVVALLLVFAGCPQAQDAKELEAQVEQQQQQITELEGQVQTLTAERDSLQMVIDGMVEKKGGTTPATGGAATGGGRTAEPPSKKGTRP